MRRVFPPFDPKTGDTCVLIQVAAAADGKNERLALESYGPAGNRVPTARIEYEGDDRAVPIADMHTSTTGQVFFQATLSGTIDGGTSGLFRGDGSTLVDIARGAHSVPGVPGDIFDNRMRWEGSGRVTLGRSYGQWLVYGTGGIAFARVDMDANFIPVVVNGIPFPGAVGSDSKTLVGGTVGI